MSRTQVQLLHNRFKEGREYANEMILLKIKKGKEVAEDVGLFGSCQAISTNVLSRKRALPKVVTKLLNCEQAQRRIRRC